MKRANLFPLLLTAAIAVPISAQPVPPGEAVKSYLAAPYVFGPTHPAVLKALGQPASDPALRFWLDVATGRWDAVKSALAALPAESAGRVHVRIATGLLGQPKSSLSPDDVLGLMTAVPGPIDAEHVRLLGRLFGRSLDAELTPARIETLRQLPGAWGTPRVLIPFLLAANRAEAASAFIPYDTEPADRDAAGIDDVIDCRAALLRQTDDAAGWQALIESAGEACVNGRTNLSPRSAVARVISLAETAGRPDVLLQWLGRIETARPDLAREATALAMRTLAPDDTPADWRLRLSRLRIQQAVLGRRAGEAAEIDSANLLAANWCAEAAMTLAPPTPSPAADSRQAIPADRLIERAPPLTNAAPAVRRLAVRQLFGLQLKDRAFAAAMQTLQAAAKDLPASARPMAGELLAAWTKADGPAAEVPVTPTVSRKVMVPVARAVRSRNVAELARMAATLRAIGPDALPADALVQSFVTLHGRAGGFAADELKAVFGDTDAMDTEAVVRLAAGWRETLVTVGLQGKAASQADDIDVAGEYALIERLLRDRAARDPDWRVNTQLGMALFEQSDYVRAKPTAGLTPTDLRRRALDALAAAATQANAGSARTPPYLQWFHCAIGLSDPAKTSAGELLTDFTELARVKQSLASWPAEKSQRIRADLVAAMTAQAATVGADRTAPYCRAALAVVGDDPSAKSLRAMTAYYDGLMAEVRLVCAVDGDANVGHGQPFGLVVSLDTTEQLDREVGGFAKILAGRASGPPTGTSLMNRFDYRERFERSLRRAWGERLELLHVLWADTGVKSESLDDKAWRRQPLAYVVAKAKDVSVDALPPVQLDLDFGDKTRSESVVLPFVSAPMALDARRRVGREFKALEAQHLLNGHDAADGTVTDEITVSGTGLVPALDELFDLNAVRSIEDRGVMADRYAAGPDSARPTLYTRRTWRVTYAVGGQTSAVFRFPRLNAAAAGAKVDYRMYAGSDVVATGDTVPLAGPGRAAVWAVGIGGVLGVVAIATAVFARARRRRGQTLAKASSDTPAALTPFGVLRQLRSLRAYPGTPLTAEQGRQLDDEIRALETAYHAADQTGTAAGDLSSVVGRWQAILRSPRQAGGRA